MAVAQFTFTTLPNPTEAALKWVETARKGSKAWTDGWLQIIATFSEVAQTQAKALKSLTPPMAVPVMATVETLPAPVEMLAEPVEAVEKLIEAMPSRIAAPALVKTPLAPIPAPIVEAKVETPPAPIAKVVETQPAPAAKVEKPAPAPVAKVKVEPAPAPVKPPVAKVRVEPLATPAPVVKAKATPAAKPVAKTAKPAAKKKP